MKIYTVSSYIEYENCDEPEFASTSREKAEEYIENIFVKSAEKMNMDLWKYKNKYKSMHEYKITELDLVE